MTQRTRARSIVAAVTVLVAISSITLGFAPAVSGNNDAGTGEITFRNQVTDGDDVVLESVSLSAGGFVGIVGDNGFLIGVSAYLSSGDHRNVVVELDDPLDEGAELQTDLKAVALVDSHSDQQYTGSVNPFPSLMTDGDRQPISDTAIVVVERTVVSGPSNEAADFQIQTLEVTSVVKGEPVNGTTVIENVGNASGTQNVSFFLQRYGTETRSVQLDPGEREVFTRIVGTSGVATGTYNVTVSTENDTATTTFEILPNETEQGSPDFQITDLDAPTTTRGQMGSITTQIENVGDGNGTQNVSYELVGENITTGTGAVDIVFVLDQSGSMDDDNAVVRQELENFTNELDKQGVDVRYAVISIERPVSVIQGFTSDVNTTRQSIEQLLQAGGGTEDNFEALALAQNLSDSEGRAGAQRVIVDITDEGSNTLTPSQQALSDSFNDSNTTYIAVTPNATSPPMSSYPEERQKRPIANLTEDGTWYDLLEGNFGERFTNQIATQIVDVTRRNQRQLTLAAGESGTVTFTIDTTNLPPETYDVTVSTANDTATTTFTVT